MLRKLLLVLVGTCTAAGAHAFDALPGISAQALASRLEKGPDRPYILDVRSAEEYASGHVPGAVNIPYDQMAARFAEVPVDREIVLYCRSGRRVAIAAEVLAGHGRDRMRHLEGDIGAWVDQGHAVETPADPAACVAALTTGQPAGRACAAP